MLEWVVISFFRGLPDPEIELVSPVLADRFFTTEPPGKAQHMIQIINAGEGVEQREPSCTFDENVNFGKVSRQLTCMLKFEQHCSRVNSFGLNEK